MRRVLVSGMGIISSLGNGCKKNLGALKLGNSGIKKAKYFKSKYANKLLFGEVPFSNEDLSILHISNKTQVRNRTDHLAQIALDEALKDAKLTNGQLSDHKTGLISASSTEGMCNTDEMYFDAKSDHPTSEYIDSYEYGSHCIKLAEEFGFSGYIDSLNTACSSSANGILLALRLIQSERLDRVIVGGVESLSKHSVNGFNALRILSEKACKPFDENRDGLNLGEGAAYLVLEAEDLSLNKHIYAEIKGAGNANDAFHPSATSDNARGPVLAMQLALKNADLEAKDIDFINAHGTATLNNDLTESRALKSIFSDAIPPFISTKSYTGHTLAAAGVIEALFSILSIEEQHYFYGLNFSEAIVETKLQAYSGESKSSKINNVISNSFGFGGNCTSLILSSYP